MGLFTPFLFAFRTFNTVANVYLAGQVGWWAFKKIRELQKETIRASELKKRFITEYEADFGEKPSPELVSSALRSYNAIEYPVQDRIRNIFRQRSSDR